MKKKISLFIGTLILCIVAGGVTGTVLAKKKGGNKSLLDKVKDTVDEKKILESETVEELLQPAGDLVAQRYYYKDVDTFENYKEFLGKKIPLTTDRSIFSYRGVISAGIVLNKIQVDVDNIEKTITLTMPPVLILSNEIEADDFTVYEVKNSVFTETKLDEFAELIGQLKQKKAAQLMSDTEFLETTRTEAEQVIRSFLKAADSTGEYTVVFR